MVCFTRLTLTAKEALEEAHDDPTTTAAPSRRHPPVLVADRRAGAAPTPKQLSLLSLQMRGGTLQSLRWTGVRALPPSTLKQLSLLSLQMRGETLQSLRWTGVGVPSLHPQSSCPFSLQMRGQAASMGHPARQ